MRFSLLCGLLLTLAQPSAPSASPQRSRVDVTLSPYDLSNTFTLPNDRRPSNPSLTPGGGSASTPRPAVTPRPPKPDAWNSDHSGSLVLMTERPSADSREIIHLATDAPDLIWVEGGNYSGPIPAGIYFRISQKGIDYITSLAAQALPELLEGSVMPTVEQPQITISKLTIEKFEPPIIKATFLDKIGVGAHVHLPKIMISAVYDASTFFTTYKGKFRADVQNLTVIMQIHISRNETAKVNIVETPVCNVTSSRVRIVFAGDMSSYLNLMRSLIEQTVIDVLGSELCKISEKVTEFFEHQKQQILMTTAIPVTSTTTMMTLGRQGEYVLASWKGTLPPTTPPPSEVENENAIYDTSDEEAPAEDLAAKFAMDLCANDRIDIGEPISLDGDDLAVMEERKERILQDVKKQQIEEKDSGNEGVIDDPQRFNPLLLEGLWAPDLTLMYAPKFTDKDVVFGLDGGIVFFGQKAKSVGRPISLNISALGDQMFGLVISEYVPNTFFAHIYDNQLGIIRETVKPNNLPKFIKPIAKLLCSKCELQLIANLTGKPMIKIDHSGVRLDIQGDVAILFVGKSHKRTRNVVTASARLDIVVKPYLQYSRIYGDVALTSVDIRVQKMGVGGMFANSLQRALNAIVPRKLWPKIKKRLRFALNQRGIKLPVICGVELERPSMKYVDHAIIIDTDFSYDLPRFVNKFKAYINAEVERAKKKQQMESVEEED